MEMLKIRLRFTPSYHPRGNYTERVNRFIGESLRTVVSMDGAKQSDWWKLTKFVEFAYRGMFIPGTNLTPFMVAGLALWQTTGLLTLAQSSTHPIF